MENWYSISGFADPMSSLSHLVGLVAFFLLSFFLIGSAMGQRAPRGAVAFTTQFVVAVLLLLSMSFVYHMQGVGTTARSVMLRLDVAAIFVLIASTFTAIHGLVFSGWHRWGMIALLWSITVTGISLRTVFFESIHPIIGDGIFLLMGWLGLFSTWMLWRLYRWRAVKPVMAGGLCYTVGAIINSVGKIIVVDRVWGPHETFHLLVLAGIGCHWVFIWNLADGSFQRQAEDPPNA